MKMTPQTAGGSPDSNVGPITMGILQNVSLDFSFDFAQLYGGSGVFPVDVRVHTGSINGQAEEAEMTGIFFALLTGGTQSNATVTFTNTTQPTEWQLELELATDSSDMNFTLNACRSSSFNVPFARDSHVITGFQFQAFADNSGNIGTLVIDDPS